jgi:rapamycin-insensitive companion of mTOR
LDEAFDNSDCAEFLMAKSDVEHQLRTLGEAGSDLLLRFLSRPAGLARLRESGFVDKELRDDFTKKSNAEYARRLGARLAAAFAPNQAAHRRRLSGINVPRHFFGELARTADGCKLLKHRRRILDEFAEVVREAADDIVGAVDSDDSDYEGPRYTPLQRRAAVLALAHVGASDTGSHLLKRLSIDVVALIAPLAEVFVSLDHIENNFVLTLFAV